nr:unnamed protein product [Digitaria exilis]
MLHAARRRTPPPPLLPAALAAAFFASKPRPPPPPPPSPLPTPRIVDAAVSRCPSDALALSFFLWCARRPGYFHPPSSFDRLLPAAARLADRLGTASALLRELQGLGCPIKAQTFLLLLRLYWRGGLYPLVLELFEQMPLWGFQPNAFARNVVLEVLLRTGHLAEADSCLRDNLSPNYLTFAIVLTHLCKSGDWSRVRCCFVEMLRHGFLPGTASLTDVFACCSKAGTMSELLQLLSFAHVSGCQLNSAMWTCLIARLCCEKRLDDAYTMLAKMLGSGCSPTAITYTPLLKGFLQAGMYDVAGFPSEAIEFYLDMIELNIRPDSYTYVGLLHSLCQSDMIERTIPDITLVLLWHSEHEDMQSVESRDSLIDGSDYIPYSSADRGATWCRSLMITFTIMLLVWHLVAVVTVEATDHCAFSLLTIYLLRAAGILLPFYIAMQLILLVQRGRQQHRLQMLEVSPGFLLLILEGTD